MAASGPALDLLQRVQVVPYSVLGQQLVRGEGVVDRAGPPDAGIVFCDPAGLPFIQRTGPGGAGGASGAIYDFLGIRDDDAFPEPVREAVTAVGLAKHHAYPQEEGGPLHCIHTVGPNFNRRCAAAPAVSPRRRPRGPRLSPAARRPAAASSRRDDGSQHSREEAQGELAAAYKNVLCEFHAAASGEGGPTQLRLLPISGGIFAGPFADEIAPLTMDALGAAAAELPREVPPEAGNTRRELRAKPPPSRTGERPYPRACQPAAAPLRLSARRARRLRAGAQDRHGRGGATARRVRQRGGATAKRVRQ